MYGQYNDKLYQNGGMRLKKKSKEILKNKRTN